MSDGTAQLGHEPARPAAEQQAHPQEPETPRQAAAEVVRGWLPVYSQSALRRAVRATVVLVGLFLLTDKVVGNLQMAVFAAFGSFATLVLSSFAGSRRDRMTAHLLLALAGSALLCIGTAVSSSTLLAALVSVPVAFLVYFAGVAGPNAASGALGALLIYVLPAASPGTTGMIPDRLAGWWMASVAGTAAVVALPTAAGDGGLRAAARALADALADELDAALEGRGGRGLDRAIAAKHELLATFNAAPYRPIGLGAQDEALADVVELLEWCTSLTVDAVNEHADMSGAGPADRELLGRSAAVLREVAQLLGGSRRSPPLEELAACRERSLQEVGALAPASPGFRREAQISFHAQSISLAVLAIAGDAMVAQQLVSTEWLDERRRAFLARGAARAARRVTGLATAAARRATVRSVWTVNSARAALAVGAAVAIADLSTVQHGFWVVLGTVSVLRTNASSTRATALQAISGTVAGFVIGSLLLILIGTDETVLWVTLPVAVFIAAYAPGTAPFAAGQAAFTVTVAILFNLLDPVGWTVGLVRVEDVALGCAVSVAFGLLFWPRGIAAVVGDDLADAFRSGSRFLLEAVRWTAGLDEDEPAGETAALSAGLRLDDALRAFLAERGSKRLSRTDLWRLVGGTLRLRLTAHSIGALPRDPPALADARDALERRAAKVGAWYEQLAAVLDRPHGEPIPPLALPRFDDRDVVAESSGSHYGVWLCEHLDHLAEHFPELLRPANRLASLRRAPWWR